MTLPLQSPTIPVSNVAGIRTMVAHGKKQLQHFYELIGFDCGWGSADHGSADAPEALRKSLILDRFATAHVDIAWSGPMGLKNLADEEEIENKQEAFPFVVHANRRLCRKTQESIANGRFPVVIGGDHSSAIGTWSGVTTALDAQEKFGMIWIDAHMDAHTPKTAHVGKWGGWWHGMPVACLMGQGEAELINIGAAGPKLSPAHMSMIGIRSFEAPEQEFVKAHGIRVFGIDEVNDRGFPEVFQEALNRATRGTLGFGLSIDLDAFDPSEAPGTGSPEKNGLFAKDVLPALAGIAHSPSLKAAEIVEYNPHNDSANKTLGLLENILFSLCGA